MAKKLTDALNQLNKGQRQAAEQIDGPLLVVAGPGTGKTQLLAVRVANILDKTDVRAENILCVTFTNKAANNMRERLKSLIGADYQKVVVKTFHSLAAELMNLYPDYFWSGASLTTVPEALQLDILQSILTKLPPDNPLATNFMGKFTAINDILSSLKVAKEAGLTPAKLEALIRANLAYIELIEPKLVSILNPVLSKKRLTQIKELVEDLPPQPINRQVAIMSPLNEVLIKGLDEALARDEGTGKASHTSRWKRFWVQTLNQNTAMFKERQRNNWWLQLSKVYEMYRTELHERGFYDYDDMIVEVISQLESHPQVLADVQERFLYVLVDEFQDTSPAQLRLAHLIADHEESNDQPNLMAVGDDDQSIFKFNGADLNNMLNFRSFYKIAKPIVLTENYRSSQAVLETAKKIIEQAEIRLANSDKSISKELVAKNPPKIRGVIEHVSFPTREHQLSLVALDIKNRRKKGQRDIAVLARGHESLRQLSGILLRNGVEISYEQQRNVLDHEACRQIILITEIVNGLLEGNKSLVDNRLSQTLRHPMWGIKPEVLWRLALKNRTKPDWLTSLSSSDDKKLTDITAWFYWLAAQAEHTPLSLMLEYVIGLRQTDTIKSPLKNYFMGNPRLNRQYLEALSAIQLIRQLVREFGRNKEASIADFVRFINVNRDNDKVLSDASPFVSGEDTVSLLTVHKAKGLEFDVVYIIDSIEDNWRPKASRRKAPANLPLLPYGDDNDDYARLMYVAVTRARHSVVATSYRLDHAGNDLMSSPLIKDLKQKTIRSTGQSTDITVLEENIAWPELSLRNEKLLLKPILEDYRLSVTALLNFLDVTKGGPKYFKEKNLLRLPEVKTAPQGFGTAIHASIEYAQRLVNSGGFDIKKVLKRYEHYLLNEELSSDEFRRYKLKGRRLLIRLFKDIKFKLTKGDLAELNVSDALIDGVRLSGKLDSVSFINDSGLVVTDYKTGKPLSSLNTANKSEQIKAWKHKTQLIFYALLVRHLPKYSSHKVEGRMVYVEADKSARLIKSYAPNQKEIDDLSQLIKAVWRHIIKLELPDVQKYTPDYSGVQNFIDDLLKSKA